MQSLNDMDQRWIFTIKILISLRVLWTSSHKIIWSGSQTEFIYGIGFALKPLPLTTAIVVHEKVSSNTILPSVIESSKHIWSEINEYYHQYVFWANTRPHLPSPLCVSTAVSIKKLVSAWDPSNCTMLEGMSSALEETVLLTWTSSTLLSTWMECGFFTSLRKSLLKYLKTFDLSD